MSKLAAMPLFWAEFFSDTAHLPSDVAKAYLYLLGHAWLRGARLPADDNELARMAGVSRRRWNVIRDDVMAFWTIDDEGFYRQKRLQKEFDFVTHRVTQNRNNGAQGGRPKGSRNKGLKNPTVPKKNPPTPTPTLTEEETPHRPPGGGRVSEAIFDRFWTAYPRRDGANPRKPARDRFRSACKSGADPEAIIAGAVSYRQQCEAKGIVGTPYVAQAATWLNQQRWQDDYGDPSVKPNGRLSPEDAELLRKHQVPPEELAKLRSEQP